MEASEFNHFSCNDVGASNSGSILVLRVQPTTINQSLTQDIMVELDVNSTNLRVLDVEQVGRHDSPQRVVLQSNPDKGNTIGIVNGEIEINGSSVLLSGSPVAANSVKHYFE